MEEKKVLAGITQPSLISVGLYNYVTMMNHNIPADAKRRHVCGALKDPSSSFVAAIPELSRTL